MVKQTIPNVVVKQHFLISWRKRFFFCNLYLFPLVMETDHCMLVLV